MKRAPIVLAATAAGLGATLGFSPHSKAPIAAAVTTTATPPSSSSSKTSSSSSSKTSKKASSSTKTVTGSAVSTRYGPVQLRVTVSGGKITKVEALQLPSSDPKSSQISSYAGPQLQQSALTKQSASIDSVSGATYTSDGYRTALQAALNTAGLQASASTSSASTG
jgi:uncharacterized protein with FMN-binding domain